MVRVKVIVDLINNTDCMESMQMMFQMLLPVILSVLLQASQAWLRIVTQVQGTGGIWKRTT